MSQRKDLTIDEVVKDPMIRMLMKADHVDPRAFETMLRALADEQGLGGKVRPGFLEDSGSGRSRRLSRISKPFNEASVSW